MADVTFAHGDPDMMDYTPTTGDLVGGTVVLLGNTTGLTCGVVPASGILNNTKGALEVGHGVYNATNLNNAANYAKVWWDAATKKVTTTSTSNALFGFIQGNGGGGANTTCQVRHWPYVP